MGVVFGGPSTEHDVSLISGRGVIRNLKGSGYRVWPVFISREGIWSISQRPVSDLEFDDFEWESWPARAECVVVGGPGKKDLVAFDFVFNALHGMFGESGHFQALMETFGIPYSGSGVLGSALAMNKQKAKEIFDQNGIRTAKGIEVSMSNFAESPWDDLRYPVFVKENTGGSSVNVGRAEDLDEARELARKLLKSCRSVLVEEFVAGREFSCGYIEGCIPVPPTEIVVETGRFFDFAAKYKGDSREITPAECPDEWTLTMQQIAKKCHEVLGLSVYSRTDILVSEGEFFVLETNTLPGMTPTSLIPQQAACVGLSYPQLILKIIEQSLKK